ncbi:hypothetical protein MVEN_00372200 [Mycena venus]|uniref:Uncharacterized protein n=1 Tax=Mycena venus TaxID=2733690 RepID=A0A8H6YUG2_9AGAR|nr:hypothetical protein MVEN_00372200 [Mycena venus]
MLRQSSTWARLYPEIRRDIPKWLCTCGCASNFRMYRHAARRLLLRNGVERVPSSAQIRFKATTPPRPEKADLTSIIPTLRELLPELPKSTKNDPSDPNRARRQRRGLLFYIALISPLFIWINVEKYFDPQPLLEKKRKRILRERLGRLRDGNRAAPARFSDLKSVVTYLRLLLSTMLPEETLRNLHFKEVCDLLEEDCPENLLAWLREICAVTYDLSQKSEDEAGEVKAAEHIQDAAEEILRKGWLAVHRRLPLLPVDAPSDSEV